MQKHHLIDYLYIYLYNYLSIDLPTYLPIYREIKRTIVRVNSGFISADEILGDFYFPIFAYLYFLQLICTSLKKTE